MKRGGKYGVHGGPWVVAGVLALLLGGCAAEAVAVVDGAGAVDVKVQVGLMPAFSTYLKDLSDTLGASDQLIFDKTKLATELGKVDGVRVDGIQVPSSRASLSAKDWTSTDVDLGVADPGRLAKNKDLGGLFEIRKEGSGNVVRLLAGPKLLKALAAYVRPGEDEALAYVMPEVGTTTAAYEKQLLWALGDYGTPAELKAMLAASKVVVRLQVPRSITGVKGLVKESTTSARFEMGVLELMTLQADRVCEVLY